MKDRISHAGGKLVRLTLITTQLNRSPRGPLIFTDANAIERLRGK